MNMLLAIDLSSYPRLARLTPSAYCKLCGALLKYLSGAQFRAAKRGPPIEAYIVHKYYSSVHERFALATSAFRNESAFPVEVCPYTSTGIEPLHNKYFHMLLAIQVRCT